MKPVISILAGTALLQLCAGRGFAQGFVNLNFASANIPAGTAAYALVPINEAIPGWIGYIGTNQITSVLYNGLYTGSPTLAVLSTNTPGAIPGNAFTVVLQAGGDTAYFPASISQTAVIPITAQLISFTASMPYADGWQVTINGQVIPITQISPGEYVNNEYEGNVSAFAGQDDTLEFTALAGSAETVNLYLDNIQFSSAPEPGELALATLGTMCLSLRHRRKLQK